MIVFQKTNSKLTVFYKPIAAGIILPLKEHKFLEKVLIKKAWCVCNQMRTTFKVTALLVVFFFFCSDSA